MNDACTIKRISVGNVKVKLGANLIRKFIKLHPITKKGKAKRDLKILEEELLSDTGTANKNSLIQYMSLLTKRKRFGVYVVDPLEAKQRENTIGVLIRVYHPLAQSGKEFPDRDRTPERLMRISNSYTNMGEQEYLDRLDDISGGCAWW